MSDTIEPERLGGLPDETKPKGSPAEAHPCDYEGMDSGAQIGSNDDSTFFARCACLTIVLDSGTMDECVAALESHRAQSRDEDDE